jgi:hypothetical protein
VLFQRTFNGSHPSNLLLQEGLGVPISFVKRGNGILQIRKLAELMRDTRKDKRNSTTNSFFAIGKHSLDWHLQRLQQPLDFLQ